MSEILFLLASLVGLGFTLNTIWPRTGPILMVPSWLFAFLAIDLPFHHIAWQMLSLPIWAWCGAFDGSLGRWGLLILLISWVGMVAYWLPALRARGVARRVAEEFDLEDVAPVPSGFLFKPFSRTRDGVEIDRDIEFHRVNGQVLRLDVYRNENREDDSPAPALVYVHGGAWIYGDKREQGLPLCNHMASQDWVCFNVNYRLCPGATYPDQVVDVKAAIAWIRSHCEEYGVDPSFIAIAGGSAGAQIAAMTVLTPGRSDLQPGFETADTSIQAAVPSYGVFDLTNRMGLHNEDFINNVIAPKLIKAFPKEQAEKFTAASPFDHVARACQPWLILQGSRDTLTPVRENREFQRVLKEKSGQQVVYAEFPAAQHAFDIYYCHRALAAVELSARFLVTVRKKRLNILLSDSDQAQDSLD